ncbi:MAG: NlpC/P60 family protein [Eubacteriales bacterium]|nr:NlpC/P60 family protein [Eubacteriales bacterium]
MSQKKSADKARLDSKSSGNPQVLSQDRDKDKFFNKQIYIHNKGERPPWLTPLLASLVCLLLILFIIPRLFRGPAEIPEATDADVEEQAELEAVALSGQVVIKGGPCPLYAEPQRQALRTSTALYGEVATVIEEGPTGWVKIELAEDSYQAWCELSYLSTDLAAVDPNEALGKAVVFGPSTRVMSHTRNGYLLFRAPMGSTLYYDYRSEQVICLRLPQGQVGWISNNGVRVFEPTEAIPVPERAAGLFASSAMNFYRSPYVPGGLAKEGADMAGVIFISAKINGLDVPRDLQRQAEAGQAVTTVKDPTTGQIRVNLLQTGDILFFHDGQDKRKIDRAAIILEEGQALTCLVNDSSLNLRDLNRESDLLSRLVTVRRYFPEAGQ